MRINAIYKLTSPSGKCYIGQTTNLNSRICKYRNNNIKGQLGISNAITKYGWDNFNIEILWKSDDSTNVKDILNELERDFIFLYDSIKPNGYNLKMGGDSFNHTEDTIKKISEGNKGSRNGMFGKTLSDETKEKISKAIKGRKESNETKLKKSISLKGRIITEEMRLKISQHSKSNTEETKSKISNAQKNRMKNRDNSHSDETKNKISLALSGRILSEEHKKKIGENSKNMSLATRLKISETLKNRNKKVLITNTNG